MRPRQIATAETPTWSTLSGKPSTFPPSTHGHSIADVSGLQTALDGKAAVSTRSFATPTFNQSTTAAQLSATRDAEVFYSYNATVAISVLAGQSVTATLRYADNSGMSTNVVTLDTAATSNSGVLGLSQTNTLRVGGIVPAGKFRQVTFSVAGGATAPAAILSGQEVLL